MQLSGLASIFILLDRSQPEPRETASTLLAKIFLIVFREEQNFIASPAPNMKSTASVAFPYVVKKFTCMRFALINTR